MRRIFLNAVIAAAILAWSGWAFAQQGPPAGRWVNPGGGKSHGGMHGGGMHGGASGRHGVRGHAPRARLRAASPGLRGRRAFRSRFGGSVTDPSFAGRLGRTVGRHPSLGVTGFGNIIFPGGAPGLHGNFPHGKGGHFQRGQTGFGGVYNGSVIYAVPYYVPVYTEVVPTAPPEQPRQFDIRQYQGVAPSPAQPQEFAPRPPARPVTLLAFKDATIIAVTDYWLQGYSLVYETSLGVRTVVPLDRLDFGLTQQLNLERNVPFVLAARP